jgi:hypothetical protein
VCSREGFGSRVGAFAAAQRADRAAETSRLTWRRTLALLAIAAVLLLGWLVYRSVRPPTPGPLHNPEASSLGLVRKTGQTWGYGLPVVINTGDEPAVLTRIEIVDPPPGLRLVDTRVSGIRRKNYYFASSLTWPDRLGRFSDLHRVAGFEIQPENVAGWNRGAELIFAVRAEKPGRYVFRAVAVEYRVGGSEHRVILDNGLAVCVTRAGPGKPHKRGCDDPPRDLTRSDEG